MAVRPSMSYIITFVRDLINDPAGSSQKYTDQQIQDRLDLNRLDLYISELEPQDFLTSSGSIEWHDFFSRLSFWETDYTIQTVNGTTKVPDIGEPLIGKFHFNANIVNTLVISGRVYNTYRVAATLMTMWIAEIRAQIQTWTADGTTVQRVGQVKNMEALANKYYELSWGWGGSTQIKLVRRDLRN